MALKLTTGARNATLDTGLRTALNGNVKINYYSGSQPATAGDAATGTLLVTVSDAGGAGDLSFDAPADGTLPKASAQTWSGTAVADGTAGWFRMYVSTDDPSLADDTVVRIDGAIATSGAQLNMSHTGLTTGAVETLSEFRLTLPTL